MSLSEYLANIRDAVEKIEIYGFAESIDINELMDEVLGYL